MANYGHVLFYSLLGGVVSLLGGLLLLRNRRSADMLVRYATPFAGGALLAAVFLDLFAEGLAESRVETVLLACLAGIVIFFYLERFLGWFHHHHQHADIRQHPSAGLIIFGDTMHNALDGMTIAAAFLVSVPTGIVTTLAVAAHEIPQEIGDFGLLLAKGLSRRKAVIVNILSAIATTLAAVITFGLGSDDRLPAGVLLGLSAGFLLYIAMSDIIPTIHESAPRKKFFNLQPFMLLIGLVTVGLSIRLTHGFIETGHDGHEEPPGSVLRVVDGKLYRETQICTDSIPPHCGANLERVYTEHELMERDAACERVRRNPLPPDPARGISADEARCAGAF